MRIILKNADFSAKNINPAFSVTLNLTGVVTDSDITSVKQGTAYSATFLVGSGYTYSSTVVTVGGVAATGCYSLSPDNDVIEVNIPANELTGDVVITIVAEEVYVPVYKTINLRRSSSYNGPKVCKYEGDWDYARDGLDDPLETTYLTETLQEIKMEVGYVYIITDDDEYLDGLSVYDSTGSSIMPGLNDYFLNQDYIYIGGAYLMTADGTISSPMEENGSYSIYASYD